MATLFSNPANNNLAEGIHKIKCKYRHSEKNVKTCGIKYKDCDCFLEYTNFKQNVDVYVVIRIIKKSLMKQFLTIISITLFYCCKKVFTLRNLRMIGKISMKFHT